MAENRNKINLIQKIIVSEEMFINQSLRVLDDSGLGVLLVCDHEKKLKGLVTDGDVRRYLLTNKSLDLPISSLMNRNFKSLNEENIHSAHEILKKSNINHIPIVNDDGEVVNLMTALDLVKTKKKSLAFPVVIMAGGKGTRLLPLTKIIPKPLIPIGDKTMIELIMENLQNNGFHDFRIIVNYKKDQIKSYFTENDITENITFIEEKEFLGTAGGLKLLQKQIDSTFLLSNCDILAKFDYNQMIDWHNSHNADLTILGLRKVFDVPYGVINIDENFYVSSIAEKPNYQFIIVTGIYLLEPNLFDLIQEESFLDMDRLIHKAIKANKKIACYPIDEGWFDIGQFEEYKNLLRHFGELGQ